MSVKADGKPGGGNQAIQVNDKGAFGPNAVDLATQAELDAHASDTTSVHGIADTSALVLTSDARLTDARTPTAHASTHQHSGGDEIATATAAANAIPKAGAGGQLDVAWLPTDLTDGGDSTLHFHSADRDRANHTGTQTAATISDFSEAVDDRVNGLLVADNGITINYNDPAGTLTLGAQIDLTGDVFNILPVGGGGTGVAALPAFSAYKNASQSISASTFTKVSFQNEDFDTNSNYDNATNYRFTPAVAGKYLVICRISFTGPLDDTKIMLASIYRNGSRLLDGTPTVSSGTGDQSLGVYGLIDCNGSTDYIEIYVYHEFTNSESVYGGTSPRGGFFAAAWATP